MVAVIAEVEEQVCLSVSVHVPPGEHPDVFRIGRQEVGSDGDDLL